MAEFLQYEWGHSRISSDYLEINSKKNQSINKDQLIENLRELLKLNLNDFQHYNDKMLMKFLNARKFNIDDTYQLILNYQLYYEKNQEIFNDLTINAQDIRKSLENGLPGVLSNKDRKGRSVLILNASNWDCNNLNLITIFRSIWLTLEHLLDNDNYNQTQGFVFIVDWNDFTLKKSRHLKFPILKLMVEGLQNCFPAKIKGVHFLGQPWFVEMALTFIKPFLKDKTRERIHLHGNNLSTLHDHIHKDILPAEYGGEKPSYNPENWLETLKFYTK